MSKGITAASVLKNQANQKRHVAAYLRQMAERQRALALEFEAEAIKIEKSADSMEGIARVEANFHE